MKNRCLIFVPFALLLLPLVTFPAFASASDECRGDPRDRDQPEALKLKLVGIASILVAGGLGVLIPVLGRWVSALRQEKDVFFVIKAFAAGVILATALVHILPGAFGSLGSSCLRDSPWQEFPFAGFVSMLSALGVLIVDTLATSHYRRRHLSKPRPVDDGDEEKAGEHAQHAHVQMHAGHGHSHGAMPGAEDEAMPDSVRHRIVAQVLELGIVVHSVIVGVSLGASQSPSTIRPLVGALSFHQFFEGMGLGSCIVQAKLKTKVMATMAVFFSVTTPVGVAVGIGASSAYNTDGATALIVEGILEAASAGILIYMSLVDLLAADFTSAEMQSNGRLQHWSFLALLLGAGFMSFLARWS